MRRELVNPRSRVDRCRRIKNCMVVSPEMLVKEGQHIAERAEKREGRIPRPPLWFALYDPFTPSPAREIEHLPCSIRG